MGKRPNHGNLRHHLRYSLTTRGIMMMPELLTSGGGALHLSESSSPVRPLVWLRASAPVNADKPFGDRHEVVLHVTLDDLKLLVDQCNFLGEHHWREHRVNFTDESGDDDD